MRFCRKPWRDGTSGTAGIASDEEWGKTRASKDEGHKTAFLARRLRLKEPGLFHFSKRRLRHALSALYKQLLV